MRTPSDVQQTNPHNKEFIMGKWRVSEDQFQWPQSTASPHNPLTPRTCSHGFSRPRVARGGRGTTVGFSAAELVEPEKSFVQKRRGVKRRACWRPVRLDIGSCSACLSRSVTLFVRCSFKLLPCAAVSEGRWEELDASAARQDAYA